MAEWVKIATVDEVPPGEVRVFEVAGKRIAVCHADADDDFYAIADVCTHDGGALDQGFLEEYEVECPRHGARFDIRTGKVLALPAVVPIASYDVKVEGDEVFVAPDPVRR
jgi:3-phenylpropionate/trans-cinnamate dioxygenase ferredoxin subunit